MILLQRPGSFNQKCFSYAQFLLLLWQVEVQGSEPYPSNPNNRSHYRLQVTVFWRNLAYFHTLSLCHLDIFHIHYVVDILVHLILSVLDVPVTLLSYRAFPPWNPHLFRLSFANEPWFYETIKMCVKWMPTFNKRNWKDLLQCAYIFVWCHFCFVCNTLSFHVLGAPRTSQVTVGALVKDCNGLLKALSTPLRHYIQIS